MPPASPTADDARLGPFSAEAAEAATTDHRDVRVAAAERAATAGWPSTDEEIWRYSRIEELDLGVFVPVGVATTVSDRSFVVDHADDYPAVVAGDGPDLFHDLNTAFSTPVVIRVPAGTVVDEPIVVTHTVSGRGGAGFPRLVVDAGENSEVVVVERFAGAAGSLTVPVVQLRAARAARIRYLAVNEIADDAWMIGHQQAVGDADSDVALYTVALGGHYARLRTEARGSGKGANTRQTALYFASGTQMHDFRTIQDHDAPRTTSNLLFKGALQDDSASVYTGLIKVRPHARGTVAYQTNRNLTLGAGAWAESVPNLEIETNDVSCSHASTVGPVDPEHRFYLESRGVPTAVADRLIVVGFFDEVLDQLPVKSVAAELRTAVIAKLDLEQVAAASAEATAVAVVVEAPDVSGTR